MSRQVPHAEDAATGTPTAGLVPISAGPGLAPAWGAAGGGGGGTTALGRCTATAAFSTFNPASGVITQLPLDSDGADPFDPDNWHDEGTSSPYIVLPATGDYVIHGYFNWAITGAPTGDFIVQMWLYGGAAGSTALKRVEQMWRYNGGVNSDVSPYQQITHAGHFAAGDKINIQMRHYSGVAMTYQGGATTVPELTVLRVG
jgi:hypothetical protein